MFKLSGNFFTLFCGSLIFRGLEAQKLLTIATKGRPGGTWTLLEGGLGVAWRGDCERMAAVVWGLDGGDELGSRGWRWEACKPSH